MNAAGKDRTGLSRAVTILCAVFLVASGLCGVNFFSVLLFADDFIMEDPSYKPKLVTRILTFTGISELAVMAISLGVLIVLSMIALVRSLQKRTR